MLGIGRRGPVGRAEPDLPGGPASMTIEARPALHAAGAPSGPDAAERDAWVVLAGAHGVGPVSFERLVRAYGSAGAVLRDALERGAAARLVAASRDQDGGPATLTPDVARAIADAARDADRRLAPTRAAGLRVLTLADEAYPARLRRIELPPPVLFLRGDVAALDRPRAVAIVGTRRPTGTGRALADRIAEAVAGLGATVVSGLALGIDAAAHAATIRAGTPTVAVIGGGHARLYPAAHRGLADAIVAGGGAVVSEFAPDVIPTRGTFPRRNRIISGLADATVVVEAGARSGALTTAAWALEQGRGLHVVPGRVGDPAVAGCLAFLREASPEARIVAGVPELLEDLGLLEAPAEGGIPDGGAHGGPADGRRPGQLALDALMATLGPAERSVARELLAGTGTVDELVASTASSGATVLGVLTSLEVRGLVLEAFGRYRPAGPLARASERARAVVPAQAARGGRAA
ncbi:MAG: DNA-processing protein DprA [Chloroflexota bacterium]